MARAGVAQVALDVEHVDRALEMTGVELLVDGAVLDRDGLGLLLVAIERAGYAAVAPHGARAAFARAPTRPCLELDCLSHLKPPSSQIMRGRKAAPLGRSCGVGPPRKIEEAYSP